MTKPFKLARAFACHCVLRLIGALAHPFPRSRTKAMIVNALCAPFFGYGAYWAMRSNPRMRDRILELERRADQP